MSHRQRLSYINAEDPEAYAIPDIKPAHFWSRTRADITKLRINFIHQWLFASIELWILIFIITALYFGTGHNPERYTINLDVAVVDFDGDIAGRYFLNAFRRSAPGNSTLHWRYKDPSDYNNSVDNTRGEVDNGFVWAIVVLRPHTTRYINESHSTFFNISTVLTSPFTITLPVLVTYEDGRNSLTVNNYVLPAIRSALAVASAQYSETLRTELIGTLSSSSNSSSARSLQLLNTFQLGSLLVNPLAAEYQNLHPALPYIGQLATTLGYLYLYLVTGMVVSGAIRFLSVFVGKIHRADLIALRVLNGLFHGFMVSLIYSLIVLWFFGIHSRSLFIQYWMFNWLTVLVFGTIIVLFTTNFGVVGSSVLTVFVYIMLSGSTIQISLELSPSFYHFGYGLPQYHIMNGGRHLLFGSHTRFDLSVGVLLVYCVIFWIIVIVTAALRIKKQEREIIREKQMAKTDKRRRFTANTGQRRYLRIRRSW